MCNVIGILAHLPQAGEETRGAVLWAPRVAGASRVMSFLGPTLRRHHGRNVRSISLDRNLESLHLDPFTFRIVRCLHNLVDEQLNVLSIVWHHPLANRALQLTVDEITTINGLLALRVTVVHQVQMIGTTFTCISRLADEILTEYLGK
jgi:hypothetical protein